MRILYLHQYFVPPGAAGGTRSYEFARRLVEKGHKVTLITSNALMPASPLGAVAGQGTVAGIDLVVLPVRYENEMSYSRRMQAFVQFAAYASLRALVSEADIVFATSTPLTIAIPGLLASLGRRIPMVFEVRDLWPEVPIAMGALGNRPFRFAARALEWLAYHGSAHVVALSAGMAEGVARRGVPEDRITVIPNGCDVDLFRVSPAEAEDYRARVFPDLKPGQPLVLYAGTFGAANGVEWLVELAARTKVLDPDVRFALVGSGARREAVRELAQQKGVLDTNLWVRDPIPKEQVPLLFASASITTSVMLPLPELRHNSANKFFDSLAAARPVAINYEGWQADLLRETGAGIVLPHADPTAAASNLVALVRDTNRLQAASLAGSRLAEGEFNRDVLADRLEAVLKMASRSGSVLGRLSPMARL